MADLDAAPAAIFYNQRPRIWTLRILALVATAAVLLSESGWTSMPSALAAIRLAGLGLLLGALFGRLWSILYIGGRKNRELVEDGPYSMTRNPLYLFSTIGALGIGLCFDSIVLALVIGTACGGVLYLTARGEAEGLRAHFGQRYDAYARRVPLFWPRPALYTGPEQVTFDAHVLRRALADSALFLVALPAAELAAWLHHDGLLPHIVVFY